MTSLRFQKYLFFLGSSVIAAWLKVLFLFKTIRILQVPSFSFISIAHFCIFHEDLKYEYPSLRMFRLWQAIQLYIEFWKLIDYYFDLFVEKCCGFCLRISRHRISRLFKKSASSNHQNNKKCFHIAPMRLKLLHMSNEKKKEIIWELVSCGTENG